MSRQSQWLFEAPPVTNAIQYANPYTNPEYYSNPELAEGCRSRTSECPPTGTAVEIISNYVTHATKVPAGEKRKLRTIADRIVRNANQGSQSIKVCIVGHADKDPRGENFERNISSQRAVVVMNELTSAISNPSILSKVSWKLICAGKDNPVVPFNSPLTQRQRNRRVEIFLNSSLTPPPPRPPSDQEIIDRAVAASRATLTSAIASLTSLEAAVVSGLLKNEIDPLAAIHRNTLDGLRTRMGARLGASDFLLKVRLVKNLMRKNLSTVASVVRRPQSNSDCAQNPFAVSNISRPDLGIRCCDAFFATGPICRRDVITHEFFHLIGLEHAPKPSPQGVLPDANSISQLVSHIVSGQSDACITGK